MPAYRQSLTVRFGDCDAAGIVFFPRYFEMLNRMVEEWFAGPLELSFKTLHQERREGVPTARFEADFVAASRLEEVLDFDLVVEKLGRASAVLHHQARCNGQLRIDVRQTIVFVDLDGMRARPWPADLRARMEAFAAEEVCA